MELRSRECNASKLNPVSCPNWMSSITTWGIWESRGGFLRRKVLLKALAWRRYWCARTGQEQDDAILPVLGDCMSGGNAEGRFEGGTLGQGKQVASYQDCPEDGSYTFASVRNSDKKGVCSQGPGHFRGNLPSYADFPFIDTSSLIIVPLGWPLGSTVLLMEGKTACSSLFLSCCVYTWAWNRAESTSPQKPWATEWKSQLPRGLNIHVKKQNHWEDLDLS